MGFCFRQLVTTYKPLVPRSVAIDMALSAFGVLDRQDDGTVQASELRHIVSALGERLTEEETNNLLRDCEPDKNGNITYKKFMTKIS